ncbi:MAG: S8 family serine peptidase [Bacteroidota bacterium]
MRYSFLFYLLLVGIIITWPACDPEDDDSSCTPDIPTLDYSDGNCSPTLYQFDNLLGFPDNGGLVFGSSCNNATDHAQIIKLNLAPTAGDEVTIHVYNATYGYANIEVFGSLDCGVNADLLNANGCFSTNAVAETFTVNGLSAYDDIFVRIDVSATGPNEPFKEYMPIGNEYIAIAAYGTNPEALISSQYAGYDPEAGLSTLFFSCDGSTSQRVILGSCNPDADVRGWRQEVGLDESESYSGDGGVVTAADVPPGMDPNTTGTALKRRRPRQNTDDFFAEADFILTVPGPNQPGLEDAQDLDPNFTPALECLQFDLGRGSSPERDQNIVVTMIDGGADATGDRPAIWNRHLNRSIDEPYVGINTLGYDFIFGTDSPIDEFGHGTATAGAVIGSYRGEFPLTVIHNKIFSVQPGFGPYGTYFGAVVATHIAGNIESNFINMSFGLSPDEEPQALTCAVKYAMSKGATIIASAGNDMIDVDAGAPQWPAAYSIIYFPQVLSVTSYNYPDDGFPDEDPILSDFSNFGLSSTNLAAYLTAKTPKFNGTIGEFDYLAGTSISAPVFTSLAATQFSFGIAPEVVVANLPSSGRLVATVQNGAFLPVCE